MRNEKPKDAAIKSTCIYDKSSGTWNITLNSPYYVQIHGQLDLYGYEDADLVIYTQKGIHVSHVYLDKKSNFLALYKNLVLFHKSYVFQLC